MFRNRSVDVHQFAMVPRADVPRSSFNMQHTHKTTFDSGLLVPVYVDEILPGDTFNVAMTAFARMSTPIFPVMDNLYLDSFFFFVPNRLVWNNWVRLMGEQTSPGDSISYTVPQIVCPAGGYAVNSIFDYMGLPTVGQVGGGNTVSHSALPLRAYNLVYQEWFRDENLVNAVALNKGDGPDAYTDYALATRGKRHDYFTSCLPWPEKGGQAVTLPLGTTAPIIGLGAFTNSGGTYGPLTVHETAGSASYPWYRTIDPNPAGDSRFAVHIDAGTGGPLVYADLSAATAATINQLRQSFQIQKLLERDARGGTRYVEKIRAHFNVVNPDFRLQRPEYLGGGTTPVTINPVAQTSGTGASGTSAPLGNLAAIGTMVARNHGFSHSFTEHGFVIGLVCVRADLTYQQGLRKMWSRLTMYDHYFPVFATLGEQAVLNKEIYCDGSGNDAGVFGYQERWAEYRYNPSMITGLFRSTAASTIDNWHLAQKFASLPTLNNTFVGENVPLSRILAVGSGAAGKQFLFDSFFDIRAARPMPLYSVPGLIDHF